MTSQINPYNINGNYPIAGQDNDSQGFRDNFTNLRNNLVFAKSEIEDLQNKVVLKRPLAGGSVNDAAFNEMDGTKLSNVQLRGWSQTATSREMKAPSDTQSNVTTVNPSIAHFWQLSVKEVGCELTLDGFPLGTGAGWGQVIVAATPTEIGNSIKFNDDIKGLELIAGYNGIDTVVFGENEVNKPRLFLIGSPNDSDFYIVDLSKNSVDSDLAITPLTAEPTAQTGMIAFANGDATDGWDPLGTDAGVPYPVYFNGSDWVTFAGAGGGSTAWADITGKPTIPADVSDLTDTNNLLKPPYSSQDLGDTDAVDLTKSAAYFTTAAAETATLAPGIEDGQIIVLAAEDVTAGNMVVTVANAAWGGSGTITFGGNGQTANLMYINGKWFCIGTAIDINGLEPSFD